MTAHRRARFHRLFTALSVLALVAVLLPAAVVSAGVDTFGDDDGSVFESDIEWLWKSGITRGCNPPANDRFCPDNFVTRGQMAAFLVRAMGYMDDGGGDLFDDDDHSIFEKDIDRLGAARVTMGCNPPYHNAFCPDDYVTRGQMAAFLVRALGYTDRGDGDRFHDDDSTVFEGDIDRLAAAGVTKGCNPPQNDRFCPYNFVTRGQMAAFLHRALRQPAPPPPPPADSVEVTGRLLDARGKPIVGAVITITTKPVVTTTDAFGQFTAKVEPGSHRLTAVKDGNLIVTRCFVGAEQTVHALGDLMPGTASGCIDSDPTFIDSDGDGLSDIDERRGWTVVITLGDGSNETRAVTSNAAVYDSDGDGLSDAEEKALLIDPNRPDTDADLLGDYAEMNVYKSHPAVADSDGDSCPDGPVSCTSNPSLWDGYELLVSKTSPTLADTDGDGLSDYREIVVGGSNPRLADLPAIALELAADPKISVAEEAGQGCTTLSSSLERESHAHVRTDTEATRMSIENTVQLHTEVEAGTGNWPPSANAKLTTDTKFSQSWAQETTSTWTSESLATTEDTRDCWTRNEYDFSRGSIEVAMKVFNNSNLALELSELRILAYRLELGGSFELVSVLAPDEDVWGEGQTLAPRSHITLTVGSTGVDASAMRRLVANPTGLMFEVGSHQITVLASGLSFATLSESVLERTALVVIDPGNGNVQRHAVATNVYRNPDGSARGVTLGEALSEIVGVDYETRVGGADPAHQVLYRIGNRTTYDVCDERSDAYDAVECEATQAHGFWVVAGSARAFTATSLADFDDLVLSNADRVVLTYVEDSDGDDVFDREEYLSGTDATVKDTDGDGLDDFAEREGWDVPIYRAARTEVFPDPRYPDRDLDGSNDYRESLDATDPWVADTDGDGANDLYDSYPLAAPCRDGDVLGLEAWWDATVDDPDHPTTAIDVWVPDGGRGNDGDLIADVPAEMILEDTLEPNPDPDKHVFLFNPVTDQVDQRIDVPDDVALSPVKPLTFSAWVNWQGPDSSNTYQTIVAKGAGDDASATLRVLVKNDGALRVTLTRWVFVKRWSPGCDSCCADRSEWHTFKAQTGEGVLSPGWTHVTVTFYAAGQESLIVYTNGEPVKEWTLNTKYDDGGLCDARRTTTRLKDNHDHLTIGGPTSDARAFQGALDDIQLYHKGLLADEVRDLYELGICPIPNP